MIVRARPDIDQSELLKSLKGNSPLISKQEKNTFFFQLRFILLVFFSQLIWRRETGRIASLYMFDSFRHG